MRLTAPKPWRRRPSGSRSAAASIASSFTPDLVPSDILGTRIYRASKEGFDVALGPVMANLVLTD